MFLKRLLPTEPNLISINTLFIFEYSKYKNIDLKTKEINLNQFLIPLVYLDLFERFDSLYFLSKNIGTKKDPRFQRFIYYKTIKEEFFFCQLNDYLGKDLINFCGAKSELIKLTNNTVKKVYQNWGKELIRYKSKKQK